MNRRRWQRWLPYLLSLVALGLFTWHVAGNAGRYRALFRFSPANLAASAGLMLLFLLINGLVNHQFYRGLGAPLSLNEGVGLAAVNTLANQLPFAGGLVAKALYLKQKHGMGYSRYLSATLALYVCFVAANGALGLLILAGWQVSGRRPVPLPLWLGLAAMLASLGLLRLPLRLPFLPPEWGRRLAKLLNGWHILARAPGLLARLVGLQVGMTFFFAARLWIAFHMLSQPVDFGQCLLFAAATVLSRLVSIAPGGLGVREGIVAAIAAALGFDAGTSVVAVALDRLIATFVIVLAGTVYTYILSRGLAQMPAALAGPGPEER